MSHFIPRLLIANLLCAVSLVPAATSSARAATIGMTGVVHTDCDATVSRIAVSADGREIDLGLLSRHCNDGEGYRIILHTPDNLGGATLVLADRHLTLSSSGLTTIIDSDIAERGNSQPAHILLPEPLAPGAVSIQLETAPKGTIY